MTSQHVEIEFLGGPYDGETEIVFLDDDGQPPAYPTTKAFGPIIYSRNPSAEPISDIAVQLYELDTVMTDDGAKWVYRFTGETTMDAAA